MSLDLCLKQLHVVHVKVFHRMQYIRLLLFYSVIFQSYKFHPYDFVRHFPVLQIPVTPCDSRAFSVAAPTVWNKLLTDVTVSRSLTIRKTFLFHDASLAV